MMLTAEKTTDSMGSMMKNQFFGEVSHSSDDPKECAMMGLIRNQKIDLEERLNDAKLKFADANLVPMQIWLKITGVVPKNVKLIARFLKDKSSSYLRLNET